MGPCFNRVGCDRRFLCAPSTSGNPFCEVNGGRVSCADVPPCARRPHAVSLQGTRTSETARFSGCSKASVPEYALKEVRIFGNNLLDASIKRPAVPSFEGRCREGFLYKTARGWACRQERIYQMGCFSQPCRNADVWNDHDINCRGNLAGRLFGSRRSRAFRFRIGSNRSTPSVSGRPANPNEMIGS